MIRAIASHRLPLLMVTSLAAAFVPDAAWAADARAAVTPEAQASVAQLNEAGAALYAARDYRRAIEKFIQAYAIDPDPNLLFNIARCYEELGELDAAIEKYEAFSTAPGADTRGRQRARESLAALREARDVARPEPEPAVPRAADAGEATPSRAEELQGEAVMPWVALGAGVAFAAVGTTFYVLGARDHDEVTDASGFGERGQVVGMTRREASDLVSSGDTKKLVGGLSLGVAGVLAATYVVLRTTGDSAEAPPEPRLGLNVSPKRGGASVSLQGSF